MKSLILFDLHYQQGNPVLVRNLDRILAITDDVDAVLLGGDNAELSDGLRNHHILFRLLRDKFSCPIGFLIGNHELWGRPTGISSQKLLHEIFPHIGRTYDFVYLEEENMRVGETAFSGTYGHYDYSFLRPGSGVTKEELLAGVKQFGQKKIIWKDRFHMNWEGKSDAEICEQLVRDFGRRLETVHSQDVISISHTIPRLSLNGWPDSPEQYFMEAYSGSNLLGDVIEESGGTHHFCGHTHARARERIGNTAVFNVGSDYAKLRYAILSSGEVQEREVI